MHKHLTWTDRLKIEKGLKEGLKPCAIADRLHVHNTTIYRELKRGRYTHLNSDLTTEERYSPEIAQQRYEENLKAKGGELKIGNDYELSAFIEKKIGEEGYERGTNENINKMIRRFLPKGTDFRKVTAAYIQRVETWINNYPREILGFETSGSLFERYVAEAA